MVMTPAVPATPATEAKKEKRPKHGKKFLIITADNVLMLEEYCDQTDRSYNALSHKLGEKFRDAPEKIVRIKEDDPVLSRAVKGRLEAKKIFVSPSGVVFGFEKDRPADCNLILLPSSGTYSLDGGETWKNMTIVKGEAIQAKVKAEDPLA